MPPSTANTIRKLPFYNSIIAASRSLGARQLSVPALGYYSPPLSAVAIVTTMIVFFCGAFSLRHLLSWPLLHGPLTPLAVLEFAARPYLWPNYAMGNSPPIATRSGWVSLAMMPFLLCVSLISCTHVFPDLMLVCYAACSPQR